jgi:hypothetical protein
VSRASSVSIMWRSRMFHDSARPPNMDR